jgi:hypothetical protein
MNGFPLIGHGRLTQLITPTNHTNTGEQITSDSGSKILNGF